MRTKPPGVLHRSSAWSRQPTQLHRDSRSPKQSALHRGFQTRSSNAYSKAIAPASLRNHVVSHRHRQKHVFVPVSGGSVTASFHSDPLHDCVAIGVEVSHVVTIDHVQI